MATKDPLDEPIAPPSPVSGVALTRRDAINGAHAMHAARRERNALAEKAQQQARLSIWERIDSLIDEYEPASDREEKRLGVLQAHARAVQDGDWRAADSLLDRRYGRPVQRELRADVTPASRARQLTDEELAEQLRSALEALEKGKPGA